MKLIVHKNQINGHPEQFLRNAGYGFILDRRRGKESFVKRLGAGHYPRLHMYFKNKEEKIIFELHLDQKQASYKGSHMHNAEYDGPVVEQEVKRLQSLILGTPKSLDSEDVKLDDMEEELGHGTYDKSVEIIKKKRWWQIFNI